MFFNSGQILNFFDEITKCQQIHNKNERLNNDYTKKNLELEKTIPVPCGEQIECTWLFSIFTPKRSMLRKEMREILKQKEDLKKSNPDCFRETDDEDMQKPSHDSSYRP